jgi:OmpA-OmpF porin, OOP family
MRTTAIVAALSFAAAAGAAQAQSSEAGWYGGIHLGGARANVDGVDDGNKASGGIDAGYRLNRNFAVEGSADRLGHFSPDYDVRALSLSAVGFLPLADQFSLYGKAGLARTHADTGGTSDDANGLVFGAGVRYDLNRQWFTKAGWDHYTKVGGADTGSGHADAFTVGVGLQFR